VTSTNQGTDPHLNPLPQGEADAIAPVGASSKIVWRIVDLILGGIFIYAGAIKALEPAGFANDIDNYKILPWFISVGLAFYLPWLEIFCGLAVILRRMYVGGLSILAALVSTFILATIAAKARGLDITCGCFGHASKNWSFTTHLALDLLLLAGIVALSFSAGASVGKPGGTRSVASKA
jgi:putative oxidoreductase